MLLLDRAIRIMCFNPSDHFVGKPVIASQKVLKSAHLLGPLEQTTIRRLVTGSVKGLWVTVQNANCRLLKTIVFTMQVRTPSNPENNGLWSALVLYCPIIVIRGDWL